MAKPHFAWLPLSMATLALTPTLSWAQKPVTFDDLMHLNSHKQLQQSEDGRYLAYTVSPDRGDPTVVLRHSHGTQQFSVVNGQQPSFSEDGNWLMVWQKPTLLATEQAKKPKDLKSALTVLNSQTGAATVLADVKDAKLAKQHGWLAWRLDKKSDDKKAQDDKAKDTASGAESAKSQPEGQSAAAKSAEIKWDKDQAPLTLTVQKLDGSQKQSFDAVGAYAFSPDGNWLVMQQLNLDNRQNGVQLLDLSTMTVRSLYQADNLVVERFDYAEHSNHFAMVAGYLGNNARADSRDRHYRDYQIAVFHPASQRLEHLALPSGFAASSYSDVKWSKDSKQLYVELREQPVLAPHINKAKDAAQLTDQQLILSQRQMHVWQGQDPLIKTNEIKEFDKEGKKQDYWFSYPLTEGRFVPLSSPLVEQLTLTPNYRAQLAYDATPYLANISYEGFYADFYAIDQVTGERRLIASKQSVEEQPLLSQQGDAALVFNDGRWQLLQLQQGKMRSPVTEQASAFANVDHDYPGPVTSYGGAGWLADDSAAWLYDEFDIWQIDKLTGQGKRLTQGYKTSVRYRVHQFDEQVKHIDASKPIYLEAYDKLQKQRFVAVLSGNGELNEFRVPGKNVDWQSKAKRSDDILLSVQSYQQYPDLWRTDSQLSKPVRLSDVNPDLKRFAWGMEGELIEYADYAGRPTTGVLYKPAGYQPGQKVPVLIYFYRLMSDRRFDFPATQINHRPAFPLYTSNGYAVFLPDIRFEIGQPGPSSAKTLVNAASKLIELGIADKDAIGLQGHSWSGYQSAFAITQTDMFKAVVSGAPVTNMTSAYNGIRYESGLTRQFQYEVGQSRIGAPLAAALPAYLQNSPVFFADKVNTPLVMMFGDEDGAVPWTEGVQYYLQLRRLHKPVVLLQYQGEGHHLKKYPNKLDYALRMYEFFEHFLKGGPTPKWWAEGEAYQGKPRSHDDD